MHISGAVLANPGKDQGFLGWQDTALVPISIDCEVPWPHLSLWVNPTPKTGLFFLSFLTCCASGLLQGTLERGTKWFQGWTGD